MSGFLLGERSRQRLAGVHPDLVRVVYLAIQLTKVEFTVLEGLRTPEQQAENIAKGVSQTRHSRHLTGHAVDLGAWVDGKVSWDWPLYPRIAEAMKSAAAELNVPLEWGGDWHTLKDGPHFQLPWDSYPA